jgi:hypothetical protein
LRDGAVLKGADHSALGRARDLEALGFLSGEVSLAGKPEELLIAIAHRCRKLIKKIKYCSFLCFQLPVDFII